MTWSVIPQIMGLCSLTLEVHHRQVLWVYENQKESVWNTLTHDVPILQTPSWFSFSSFFFFCFSFSFSVSQRRPLFMTEFQFGGNWKQVWLCFFISGVAVGVEDFVSPRPLSFCGACSSRSTSLSHVILAFWLVFGALCLCLFFVRVTHLLLLFTSSISQVVGHTDKRSPHSLTSLLT